MYLSATNEKIQIVLTGNVNTNQLQFTASFNDVTSAGITLPQSSSQGVTNNTTDVDMVAAPAASTTRQVMGISVYNADVATAEVTIIKDVSGADYVLTKQTLSPGDTLFYTWGSGWNVLPGTGSENVTFSVFTSNGTYTKPQGLKFAHVFCIGGGGGAGSGRRGPAGENRYGGGGGAGGNVAFGLIQGSSIASTVAVTVGTGGTGGAAITTNATSGSNGTAGGNTSFGGIFTASGGNSGSGGTTTNGLPGGGGSATTNTPQYGPFTLTGSTGNSGSTNSASSNGVAGFNGTAGGAGGAGGSGINSGNTAATSAGAGGGVYQNGILISGPVAGSAAAGSNNKSVYLHFSQTLTSGYGLGTGGAGGFPSVGKYDGGAGGNYGAGGAGGSASLDGTNSGKGGDGGGGLCVVMNIF